MERRAAWSAASGVVALLFGGGAGAWASASAAVDSGLPRWPAFVFAGVAVVGLYCVVAPLMSWWPFRGRERLEPWVLVDGRIQAATTLQIAVEDELEPIDKLHSKYAVWRNATRAALPDGWRGDFTNPDRAGFDAFAQDRDTSSADAPLATQLAWDLQKLREIKDKMRQR